MSFCGTYTVKIKNRSLLFPWQLPQRLLYGYLVRDEDGIPFVVMALRKAQPQEMCEADVICGFVALLNRGRWNNIPRNVAAALGEEVNLFGNADRIEIHRKDEEERKKFYAEIEERLKDIVHNMGPTLHKR